jgi:molecular chaperone DnaK
LPASCSDVFYTCFDDQEEVEISIYQGEHRDVRHNHHLGRFLIEGLSHVPSGNEIVVQLNLNLDGVLKVSAREKCTGLQKHIVVDNALARHDGKDAAARQRLEQLWGERREHSEFWEEQQPPPPEETAPALFDAPSERQRDSVQVRALVEKAERLLDNISAEDRPDLQKLVERLRSQLDQRQYELARSSSAELADMLFYLEDA